MQIFVESRNFANQWANIYVTLVSADVCRSDHELQ